MKLCRKKISSLEFLKGLIFSLFEKLAKFSAMKTNRIFAAQVFLKIMWFGFRLADEIRSQHKLSFCE